MTSEPASLPRLVPRPGVHVLRRGAGELQVGLDPARAVVLPDRPSVRALVSALTSPASPRPREYDADALDQLVASDLLVDADTLLPLLPTDEGARGGVAAVAAQDGDGTPGRLRARQDAVVEVTSCGGPEARTLREHVVALLRTSGLREPTPPARRRAGRGPRDEARLGLLVCVGEPAREELDGWMRAGLPHLLLRLVEGHAVVGPFVLPGETACLRCLDAHHTDVDPCWPLLVAQYASAVARDREDSVPEPVDPLLAALAAAWAAREVVSHVEGRRVSTTSATIRLDPHLTALETRAWPRHPECGCSWA
jgi:bacteriocin biosynthesis cyclodehydratase domain-containing protein